MKRRDFLVQSAAGFALFAPFILTLERLSLAEERTSLQLLELQRRIDALGGQQVLLVEGASKESQNYHPSWNLLPALYPKIRAVCRTTAGVQLVVQWLAEQKNPRFAVAGGRHSYEGFSQSEDFVLDLRGMMNVEFAETLPTELRDLNSFKEADGVLVTDGGAVLGSVYATAASKGFVFPAGSCPTVGLGGHLQGGGMGLLGRAYGLACDNLLAAEVVTAKGEVILASEAANSDLYWALRGGGGGTFGVVTRFWLRIFKSEFTSVYRYRWYTSDKALLGDLYLRWQEWAETCPDQMSNSFELSQEADGTYRAVFYGQIPGEHPQVEDWTSPVTKVADPSRTKIKIYKFMDAVSMFAGDPLPPSYFKATSDYVANKIPEKGVRDIVDSLQTEVYLVNDSYGGAIAKLDTTETAFRHRDVRFCIETVKDWGPSSTKEISKTNVQMVKDVQKSLQPYVTGAKYVNFCDLSEKNWRDGYWGSNYTRLHDVKRKYDPQNLFKHAQSVT